MRWLWMLLFSVAFLAACDRDRSSRHPSPYGPEQYPSSAYPPASDAGTTPEGGGPSTAPSVTPQPGDIQI